MSELEARWGELVSGRTRAWWAGPARGGLTALSWLYGAGIAAYRGAYDLHLLGSERLPCRVVSVGNMTVGGTGKTTTVRWLVRRLLEWGRRPAILSHAYRAKPRGSGPVVVAGPEGIRTSVEFGGDEPQLLARSLPGVPVLAGRRRVVSGRMAAREFGADVCVLDDGFQYWRMARDLELVLVSAADPFGGDHILPRGRLREPHGCLRRADAVIVTHADRVDDAARARLREKLLRLNPRLAIAEARHVPVGLRSLETARPLDPEELREGRWLALSSLGQPDAFDRTLADLGTTVANSMRFPDHHPYGAEDLRRVGDSVRSGRLAGVVTTEKDSVKIPPGWLAGVRACVLEIDLEFTSGKEEQEAIEGLLREKTAV